MIPKKKDLEINTFFSPRGAHSIANQTRWPRRVCGKRTRWLALRGVQSEEYQMDGLDSAQQ
jgi:hypothetical protein